ncbi:hypothetical protein GCM10007426_29220 [Alloalcanivorax dieselolei]|nr:hypothetical protein GCM10007426_29220 [Alloalcanivorax dieselolei]
MGVDGQTGLDKTAMAKPGDPIVLNFNRPLDRESVRGKVSLMLTDNNNTAVPQDIDYYADGAALVIKPKEPLRYSPETNPTSYRLQLASGIKDLRGEDWSGSFDEEFLLPHTIEKWMAFDYSSDGNELARTQSDTQLRSPFILGLYPGFPCVLDESTLNLASLISGRCKGGIYPNDYGKAENDLMPIIELPANRPIIVAFSQDMDPSSFHLGTSFIVEHITENGDVLNSVPGDLEIKPRSVYFHPHTPWKKGDFYRYTLVSNGQLSSSDTNCGETLCSLSGLPLQTQLLANIQIQEGNFSNPSVPDHLLLPYKIVPQTHLGYDEATGGGPNLVQYFIGAPPTSNVLQMLTTSPISDINGNLVSDRQRIYRGEDGERKELRQGLGWNRLDPNNPFFYKPEIAFDGIYELEEPGPKMISDPNTESLTDSDNLGWGYMMDPDGVKPSPNSAKVLSSRFDVANPDADWPYLSINNTMYAGANVGCGYQNIQGVDSTCQDNPFPGLPPICAQERAVPSICPTEKFTYLSSVLFAEVTSEVSEDGSIKVNIFPGHVVTTSFLTVVRGGIKGTTMVPTPSGYQVMRMRYTEDGSNNRIYPIEAEIGKSPEGTPQLSASVDLYLDAPLLWRNIQNTQGTLGGPDHNFFSYETSFSLTGGVKFLEDGRMIAEQINQNEVNFSLRGNQPATFIDLIIPKEGSFLQYISQPIKE